MISKINYGISQAAGLNVQKNTSVPVDAQSNHPAVNNHSASKNVAFKGFWKDMINDLFSSNNQGDILNDETVNLIERARANLLSKNRKKGSALAQDGTLIRYEVLNNGISLDLDSPSKEFKRKYGNDRIGIATEDNVVTWYTETATFMIPELEKGTIDKPLMEYLPVLCKMK